MSTNQHVSQLEPRLLFAATPNNNEQYLLELINAARANPSALLTHLLNSPDTALQNELTYFNVNRTVLAQQFGALATQPPLAWNANLGAVAETHNQLMITNRDQQHMFPGEANLGQRVIDSGYAPFGELFNANALLYGYAASPVEAAAAFLINWEAGATNGISSTTTFRDALFTSADREIGLSFQSVPSGGTPYFGPNAVTVNVASRANFSPVLLGVAYDDNVRHDSFYTPGEGLAGLAVTATRESDNATFTTTTSSSGGYALTLPAGTYTVTFAGTGLANPFSQSGVVIDDQNVHLNAATYTAPPPGSDPGTDPGTNPGTDPGTSPGTDPGTNPGTDPGTDPTPTPFDLTVAVSKPPAAISPGAKVPLTVTVTNTGPAYTGPVAVTVYFSKDKKVDTKDKSLPTVTVPVSIGANKTKSVTVDAGPLALLLPTGSYYILVKIAPAGDTNPANNTAVSASAAKVTAATTNLVPTLNGTPAPNKQKKTLPFNLALKNAGNVTATGVATLTLSLRPAKGADIPLLPLGPLPLNIKPNATLTLPKSVSLAGIAKGTYKLVIKVTSTLLVSESKTSDNTVVSAAFTIK